MNQRILQLLLLIIFILIWSEANGQKGTIGLSIDRSLLQDALSHNIPMFIDQMNEQSKNVGEVR